MNSLVPVLEDERCRVPMQSSYEEEAARTSNMAILCQLADYLLPRDNAEYRWRIGTALGLLVTSKGLNVAVGTSPSLLQVDLNGSFLLCKAIGLVVVPSGSGGTAPVGFSGFKPALAQSGAWRRCT